MWLLAALSLLLPGELPLEARSELLRQALEGELSSATPSAEALGYDLAKPEQVTARKQVVTRRLESLDARLESLTSTTSTTAVQLSRVRQVLKLEAELLSRSPESLRALVQAEKAQREAEAERKRANERVRAAARMEAEAELARRAALAAAARAVSEKVAELEERTAAIEEVKAELSRLKGFRSQARTIRSRERKTTSSQIQRLVADAHRVRTASQARALFDGVQAAYEGVDLGLSQALSLAEGRVRLPDVPALLEPPTSVTSTIARAAYESMEAARKDAIDLRSSIDEEELRAQAAELAAWAELSSAVASARNDVWSRGGAPRLDPFQPAAFWKQLEREARVVFNRLRAYVRLRTLQISQDLEDPSSVPWRTVAWPYVKGLLVALLAVWLHNRIYALRRRLLGARQQLRSIRSVQLVNRVERALGRYAAPLLFVLAVEAIGWVTVPSERGPELVVAQVLARWFGVYWLLQRVLVGTVLGLARRNRRRITVPIEQAIERSVVTSTRGLVGAGFILNLTQRLLGGGYLATTIRVLVVAWLVLMALRLVNRWRTAIADAYLDAYPQGRFAKSIEQSKNRWTGFVVLLGTFVVVALRSIYTLAKDALLQIEQIRRALAFLFRVRLERLRDEAASEAPVEDLPMRIRATFTTRPLDDSRLRVDRFPHVDDVEALLEACRKKRGVGSVLVSGRPGYGKTTWLHRLEEVLEGSAIWLSLAHDPESDLHQEMLDYLYGRRDKPPVLNCDVLLLDDLHRILARRPGGLMPYERLVAWMESTEGRPVFVASIHEPFRKYLDAALPHRVPFRREWSLGPWTEDDIRRLIMARAAMSGVVHEFDQLVRDGSSEEAMARSGEAYTRLIWDYADGSPRVALHCWTQSLVPVGGKRVRVRLFRSPSTELLEQIPQSALWLYGAMMLHDGLRPDDAGPILRWPTGRCESVFRWGMENEVLCKDDQARFRPQVAWELPLLRHLRRYNVL